MFGTSKILWLINVFPVIMASVAISQAIIPLERKKLKSKVKIDGLCCGNFIGRCKLLVKRVGREWMLGGRLNIQVTNCFAIESSVDFLIKIRSYRRAADLIIQLLQVHVPFLWPLVLARTHGG